MSNPLARLFGARITDDLGKTVPMIGGRSAFDSSDAELTVLVQRVTESFVVERSYRRDFYLVVATAAAFVLGAFTAAATKVNIWYVMTPLILAQVVVSLFMQRAIHVNHAQRLVTSLLFAGRCPSCGYDLRAQSGDPAGICTCPECSAAWRYARIGKAAVRPSDLPARAETSGDTPPMIANAVRWLRRPGSMVDARQRVVPITHTDLAGLERWMTPDAVSSIRHELLRQTRSMRFACGGAVLLGCVLFLLPHIAGSASAASGITWHYVLWFVSGSFMSVTALIWAYRFWTGRTGTSVRTVASTLLTQSICPSCLTNLAAVPPLDDGSTLCPSCGAAWIVPAGAFRHPNTATHITSPPATGTEPSVPPSDPT